jgi:hypothetical protein
MTMDERRKRIHIRALESLIDERLLEVGDTPQDIASFLNARDIKGERYSSESCPLTNYMWEEIEKAPGLIPEDGSICGVEVTGDAVEIYMLFQGHTVEIGVELTPPAAEFIGRFDNGDFPELVDEDEGRSAAERDEE